ncbi:MFS transporter [Actinophytocola sp.]|uniref:MFS transporter n=1 Tax=Actinophytocola sp. TaxID=1872138 RepID=UPI002D6079BA|nr:MFS transporter [Actinophytocola sp.]HYQ62582.1 MFS transporter [Actinophytocola sp.]
MTTADLGSGVDDEKTAPVPLSRNRNYNILWTSQLISQLASSMISIAIPLLILANTGSALQVGVAASVIAVARMVANVPAGVVADRLDRRRIMLTCQALRALAITSLMAAALAGEFSLPHVLIVAALEGVLVSAFEPAEDAALPGIVPAEQLSEAVARNTARPYIAHLLGPAAAGVVFAVHPMLPFAIIAVAQAGSCLALVFLRLPRPSRADTPSGAIGEDVRGGFRWVLGHKVIRSTLAWLVFTQLVFSALIVVIISGSSQSDVSSTEIGFMMAFFGAGGILGASVASRLYEAVPSRVIVIGFSFVAAGLTALMAAVPAGIPFGVVLGATSFFVPVTVTAIMTYQMMVTPDELRGRLSGIVGLVTGGAGALGPTIGGLLMADSGSGPTSLLLCAACLGAVALGSLCSPTLRRFPSVRGEVAG